MKVIAYGEEHIVTTDEVAEEVLLYARELGRRNSADTIKIPAVYSDGHVGQVRLLIGPASQITVLETAPVSVDIPMADFLADIRRRSADIRPSRAAMVQDDLGTDSDYDPDAPTDGS